MIEIKEKEVERDAERIRSCNGTGEAVTSYTLDLGHPTQLLSAPLYQQLTHPGNDIYILTINYIEKVYSKMKLKGGDMQKENKIRSFFRFVTEENLEE